MHFEGFSVGIKVVSVSPHFPQPGEGERLRVRVVDEHGLFAFGAFDALPLVEPVGWDDTTPFGKRISESVLGGDGFCAGVDHPGADPKVLCPERHQPPAQRVETTHTTGLACGVHELGRGDVVAGIQGCAWSWCLRPEEPGQFIGRCVGNEATTHATEPTAPTTQRFAWELGRRSNWAPSERNIWCGAIQATPIALQASGILIDLFEVGADTS